MALYLCISALLISVYAFFKWTNSYWWRHGCHGPAGIPLFGSMYQYFMMRKHYGVIYDEIYNDYPKAEYVGFYKFGSPSILVRSIELARTILVDSFSAFSDNDVHLEPTLDPLFMKNPFFCDGDEWKRMRSQVGMIFSANKVRQVVPLVAEVCDKLVAYIDDRLTVEHEAKKIYTQFTIESVASCGFGVEAQTFTNPESEFMEKSLKVFEMTTLQLFRHTIVQFLPALGSVFKLSLLPPAIDVWIREMVNHVVGQRSASAEKRHDFLQVLLDAHAKNPSDYDANSLSGHALSFLTEGSETSSTTMSYLTYELARNPDIQRRLQAEIDQVLSAPSSDGRITEEALNRMPLLENAVYETLRLHSVVFSINRLTTKEVELPPQLAGGDKPQQKGVTLPKGIPIILPVYSWHKDPALYDSPDEFRPERFDAEGRAQRQRYAFLGFGEGPRICPGIRFGMLQTKAAIATILRHYNVQLSARMREPLTFAVGGFIKTSDTGIWVRFQRRSVVTD